MANRGVIKALWETYKQQVVPADASEVQVEETWRAFWAGSHVGFGAVVEVSLQLDEAAAEQALSDINDEFTEHVEAFKKKHKVTP